MNWIIASRVEGVRQISVPNTSTDYRYRVPTYVRGPLYLYGQGKPGLSSLSLARAPRLCVRLNRRRWRGIRRTWSRIIRFAETSLTGESRVNDIIAYRRCVRGHFDVSRRSVSTCRCLLFSLGYKQLWGCHDIAIIRTIEREGGGGERGGGGGRGGKKKK